MMRLVKTLALIVAVCIVQSAYCTHLRAGEIRAERLSCNSLTYRITLIIYTNTLSATRVNGGLFSWGEGSLTLPLNTNVTIVNAALHIGKVTYTQDVTYSREGIFTVSYEEAHRNVAVLNIPNSTDNLNFYVEDVIHVSRSFCDSSPSFLVAPVDEGCKGVAFYHNPGATDPDGDSLSYSITIPKAQGGVMISAYSDPNDPKFYSSAGINYQTANSDKNGPPTFSISSTTGLLTWDAPGLIGPYNIAIKVTQWKKNPADSTWMDFGYVVRDMQITIQDCSNHPPDITSVQDICLIAGELANIEIRGKDQDHDNVIIEVFSDITSFAESPAELQFAGLLQSTSPDTAHVRIKWRPDCIRIRDQSYSVVVKITDQPIGGVKLTRFRSFNIRVIGPRPVISQVSVNPVAKKVTLAWNSYACQNAEAIQVWRRVSKKKYAPAHCESGMPKSLQYKLITELPANAISYEDNDLAIGAQYCYRIVARFKDVASKISLDTCLIPQPAKAPVITNVTVNKTNSQNGEITISWRAPYDIDKTQYPPPYQYEVQRGNSFSGGNWSTISQTSFADTTYLDATIPTLDTAYHYRVLLFVPSISAASVDTSSTASSVKLKGKSTANNIQLSWDAQVPWSIFLETHPYHYIYRGENGADGTFKLIDSVIVADNGLLYIDEGKFNNLGFNDHTDYSYKIETLGGYGNPKIKEPFINYSQVITVHLLDTIPPCPPIVNVVKPDCAGLPCAASYSNTVKWYNDPSSKCQNDVVSFEVYISESPTGTFTKWKEYLSDSTIVQGGLKDLSGCYRVVAIDWVGNRSDISKPACGENCPVVNMPNVFTPDATPNFNDTFRAFDSSGSILNNECSRFIDYMTIRIINRWGKEVTTISSNDIEKVAWDGKDRSGQEMPSGIYYFLADVRLKYSYSKFESQTIKGWVSLVR